tara:strand:+ start:98 stop:646 length:549 start_codon:yes stop_codon:yes gene_type:complete
MVAAINEDLTWLTVGAMDTGNGPVRDAFIDGKMVILKERFKLYKFNTDASLTPNKTTGIVTPWWSAYNAYDVDPGWQAKLNMASSLGTSIRELGRVTSAISEDWSSCGFLSIIELTVPIKVAYGRFKHQKRNQGGTSKILDGERRGRGKTPNLPGGGRQFYIPNLKTIHFGESSQSISLMGL